LNIKFASYHQPYFKLPFSNMTSTSASMTAMVLGFRPILQSTVWLLNIMNLTCAFPGVWILLPVSPKQHQLSSALYCSLILTTIYALAEHLAINVFGSSWRPPWIWVVAISPTHLWCADLCLKARREIRQSRTEHLVEKNSAEQTRIIPSPWWKSDAGSTAICLIPAAILNGITSAAMLLFERKFDQPMPHAWTPLLKAMMNCFTVAIFAVSRCADYMILRSRDKQLSHTLCGRDVVVGSIGVIALFVVRLLCHALMPASAFNLPA
jgi:hypothetical protein